MTDMKNYGNHPAGVYWEGDVMVLVCRRNEPNRMVFTIDVGKMTEEESQECLKEWKLKWKPISISGEDLSKEKK